MVFIVLECLRANAQKNRAKLAVSSVKLAILHIKTKNENLLQIVKKRFVFRTYDFLRPTKFKRNP